MRRDRASRVRQVSFVSPFQTRVFHSFISFVHLTLRLLMPFTWPFHTRVSRCRTINQSSFQCLSCRHFKLGSRCLRSCDDVPRTYEAGNRTCKFCDKECAKSCTDEGADNCDACKHVKDGPYCKEECPHSKYTVRAVVLSLRSSPGPLSSSASPSSSASLS